ncbi:MAG: hypothetical protein QM752_06405 [Gammaproteobacteria bacterium]
MKEFFTLSTSHLARWQPTTHIFKSIQQNIRFFSQNKESTRLKTTFNCPVEYRKQFPASTAQITISVGQPVHEGERIEGVVQLVNRSFKDCIIMLDDSIQSYTNAIAAPHKSKEMLLAEAIKAGDEYLERNGPIFKANLTIPYRIKRWKDWLGTPEWRAAVREMREAYAVNSEFHQGINACVNTFLQRYEKNKLQHTYDRAHAEKLCITYLVEECGVMKDLWTTLGSHFEVYPSGRNEAMDATYKLFIEPKSPHLLRPVAIRFNRRKIEEADPDMKCKHDAKITTI